MPGRREERRVLCLVGLCFGASDGKMTFPWCFGASPWGLASMGGPPAAGIGVTRELGSDGDRRVLSEDQGGLSGSSSL